MAKRVWVSATLAMVLSVASPPFLHAMPVTPAQIATAATQPTSVNLSYATRIGPAPVTLRSKPDKNAASLAQLPADSELLLEEVIDGQGWVRVRTAKDGLEGYLEAGALNSDADLVLLRLAVAKLIFKHMPTSEQDGSAAARDWQLLVEEYAGKGRVPDPYQKAGLPRSLLGSGQPSFVALDRRAKHSLTNALQHLETLDLDKHTRWQTELHILQAHARHGYLEETLAAAELSENPMIRDRYWQFALDGAIPALQLGHLAPQRIADLLTPKTEIAARAPVMMRMPYTMLLGELAASGEWQAATALLARQDLWFGAASAHTLEHGLTQAIAARIHAENGNEDLYAVSARDARAALRVYLEAPVSDPNAPAQVAFSSFPVNALAAAHERMGESEQAEVLDGLVMDRLAGIEPQTVFSQVLPMFVWQQSRWRSEQVQAKTLDKWQRWLKDSPYHSQERPRLALAHAFYKQGQVIKARDLLMQNPGPNPSTNALSLYYPSGDVVGLLIWLTQLDHRLATLPEKKRRFQLRRLVGDIDQLHISMLSGKTGWW